MNYLSTSNRQHFDNSSNISLRITSNSLLVCSNKFRQHLAQLFDLRGAYLNKTGPQRKYFQEGVLRLATDRGLPGQFPFSVAYKGHTLVLRPVREEEADRYERESHKKMYLGGVGPYTNVSDVEQYFELFGPVAFVQLMGQAKFETTKFGFVIFEDHWTMMRVLGCGPHYLHGYRLRVTDYVNNTRNKKKKKSHSRQPEGHASAGTDKSHFSLAVGANQKTPDSPDQRVGFVKVERQLPTTIEIILRDGSGLELHRDQANVRFNLVVPRRLPDSRENERSNAPLPPLQRIQYNSLSTRQ